MATGNVKRVLMAIASLVVCLYAAYATLAMVYWRINSGLAKERLSIVCFHEFIQNGMTLDDLESALNAYNSTAPVALALTSFPEDFPYTHFIFGKSGGFAAQGWEIWLIVEQNVVQLASVVLDDDGGHKANMPPDKDFRGTPAPVTN